MSFYDMLLAQGMNGGGGGAGGFIVRGELGENDAVTIDKTPAEICAAAAAGKAVTLMLPMDDVEGVIQLDLVLTEEYDEDAYLANFAVVISDSLFAVSFVNSTTGTAATVSMSLPEVSSTDNGDLLGVVDGAWAKVSPQDYYIPVTVTAGSGGTFTATTTVDYSDAVAAALAGKNLIAKCSGLSSAIVDVPLESVAEDGSYMLFSRVAYLNAILYFKARWTSSGITLTVTPLAVAT